MTNRKTYYIDMLKNKLQAYYDKVESLNAERNSVSEIYKGKYAQERYDDIDKQLGELLTKFNEELSVEWTEILQRLSILDFIDPNEIDYKFLEALTSGMLTEREITYSIHENELNGNYSNLKAINKYQTGIQKAKAKSGEVFLVESYKTVEELLEDYKKVSKSAMQIATALYSDAKDENYRLPLEKLAITHFCTQLPSNFAKSFEIPLPLLTKENEDKSHYFENMEKYKLFYSGELMELEFIKRA